MGETKIRVCGDVWALCDRLGIPHFEFCWDGMFPAARAIERLEEANTQLMEAMWEAIGSLRCADTQSLPSDDQIIMGRVREAATVLETALKLVGNARACAKGNGR